MSTSDFERGKGESGWRSSNGATDTAPTKDLPTQSEHTATPARFEMRLGERAVVLTGTTVLFIALAVIVILGAAGLIYLWVQLGLPVPIGLASTS